MQIFVKKTAVVPVPFSVPFIICLCDIGTVPEKLLTVPTAPLDVRFGNTKVYINDTLDVDQVRPLTLLFMGWSCFYPPSFHLWNQ